MRRLLLLLGVLLLACGEPYPDVEPPTPEPVRRVDPDDLCVEEGRTRCRGQEHQSCSAGEWVTQAQCGGTEPVCDAALGCIACEPGARVCVGPSLTQCTDDGELEFIQDCAADEECSAGACRDACDLAEDRRSYLGCRFLAVSTINIVDEAFDDDFAVVVANPHDRLAAELRVERGGQTVLERSVAPGGVEALRLPVVASLKAPTGSALVPGGAYEIASSLPVAAYQFNPLNFSVYLDGRDVYSYTNDASLLLPEHALGSSYLGGAFPTWGLALQEDSWLPGFLAIAAVEDGTAVDIDLSAWVQAGGVDAGGPGETRSVVLDRGEVLQLLSRAPDLPVDSSSCAELGGRFSARDGFAACWDTEGGDLTGSAVRADRPVAVWGGHACTFLPFDRFACDHLEEMLLPRSVWGREVVLTAPTDPGGNGLSPTLVRVLSGADGTRVTVLPEGVVEEAVLAEGEVLAFETEADIVVSATAPVSVLQGLATRNGVLDSEAGDPAMGTGIPRNQWRSQYDFLSPDTYTTNRVDLVAPEGAVVYLDGVLVEGWRPLLAGDGLQVARLEVEGGPHRAQSLDDVGFGVTLYGYARYTSFLAPGGLNLVR